MVGLLGCGCCATEPSELCTDAIYQNQIIEDYSPTFDPYFFFPTGQIAGLVTENGYCRCAGYPTTGFYDTYGYQYGVFKKTTLLNPIESFIQLTLWDDFIYQGPYQYARPELIATVGIRDGGGFLGFIAPTYRVVARAYWFNSTGFVFSVGTFGVLIPIRPKTGDVFGVRLSDFTIDANVTWQTQITPSKAEFVLNGETIYTVTDSQYFVPLKACQFDAGIFLTEPAFIQGNYVFPHKLRVDNFTVSAS